LAHQFAENFLIATPWKWLEHFPRYLQAILTRLEKMAAGSLEKDMENTRELTELYDQFEHRQTEVRQQGIIDGELDYYGWMLQEYRVSLFAQKLGTSETVSAKRLEKQWKKVT
jgi:ATP-dependent helicase HrpA